MAKKLKFEIDTDGGNHYDFTEPSTVVNGFDPKNPGATLGTVDQEVRIYLSHKSPKCVTIYINGRAYQV
jgi:hypothetical protein